MGVPLYIVYCNVSHNPKYDRNHFEPLFPLTSGDPRELFHYISREEYHSCPSFSNEVVFHVSAAAAATAAADASLPDAGHTRSPTAGHAISVALTKKQFGAADIDLNRLEVFLSIVERNKRASSGLKILNRRNFVSAVAVLGINITSTSTFPAVIEDGNPCFRVTLGEQEISCVIDQTKDMLSKSRKVYASSELFSCIPAMYKRNLFAVIAKNYSSLKYAATRIQFPCIMMKVDDEGVKHEHLLCVAIRNDACPKRPVHVFVIDMRNNEAVICKDRTYYNT